MMNVKVEGRRSPDFNFILCGVMLTQSGPMEDTGSTLMSLHEEMCTTMEGEDLMTYLLSSVSYLKNMDLDGWRREFKPTPLVIKPVKRRRIGPNTVLSGPERKCLGCPAERSMIDDVQQGCVVCTACGLIQDICALDTGSAHMSMNTLMTATRHVVHRYSRVVYFRGLVMSFQGETNPMIPKQVLDDMRLTFDGKNCTPTLVRQLIKMNKWPARYLYHVEYLTSWASRGKYKPPYFDQDILMKMYGVFRRLEFAWDKNVKKRTTRSVFPGYKFIFYQLCHHFGHPEWTGKKHLLKSPLLLQRLCVLYEELSNLCGLKFMPVGIKL